MKKGTKCDKCKVADANVYFAVVSGKGKTSRKQYCRHCADEEKIQFTTRLVEQRLDEELPAIDLVQKEMEKAMFSPKQKPVVQEVDIDSIKNKKLLEKEMKKAIEQEDYEKAAKIRDKMNSLDK